MKTKHYKIYHSCLSENPHVHLVNTNFETNSDSERSAVCYQKMTLAEFSGVIISQGLTFAGKDRGNSTEDETVFSI